MNYEVPINTRVTKETYRSIKQYAKAAGMKNLSEAIRKLLSIAELLDLNKPVKKRVA